MIYKLPIAIKNSAQINCEVDKETHSVELKAHGYNFQLPMENCLISYDLLSQTNQKAILKTIPAGKVFEYRRKLIRAFRLYPHKNI